MYGEPLRLSWRFSDQSSGFRDYVGDTYGRRNFVKPEECANDVLYVKIPFPCFQEIKQETGISVVMSPIPLTDPVMVTIPKLPKRGNHDADSQQHSLHDLSFRIDYVGMFFSWPSVSWSSISVIS